MILDDDDFEHNNFRDYDDTPEQLNTAALDGLAEQAWPDALVPANHDRHQAQAAIWRALDDTGVVLEPTERGYITAKLMARLGYGS